MALINDTENCMAKTSIYILINLSSLVYNTRTFCSIDK